MKYQCECGCILRNVYPNQLDKHRRSKKHLNCLLTRHIEWDRQKKLLEKPILEIINTDPVEISFD